MKDGSDYKKKYVKSQQIFRLYNGCFNCDLAIFTANGTSFKVGKFVLINAKLRIQRCLQSVAQF